MLPFFRRRTFLSHLHRLAAGSALLALALLAGLRAAGAAPAAAGAATPAAPAGAPITLRVMTYNIHHGEGIDKKIDLARIAALITQEKVDLVGVQEVDKGVERSGRRDLIAELATLTGLTPIFAKNINHQGGEYGNAILSRFPIKSWANTHLRASDPAEQRGVLRATLDVHGRTLVFLCTHLDHRSNDAARWEALPQLDALIAPLAPAPAILVGDFNDVPTGRVYRQLATTYTDTWAAVGQGEGHTIPAERPRKRIDYLWITPQRGLEPVRAWVLRSEASDHLPVVAEYRLK